MMSPDRKGISGLGMASNNTYCIRDDLRPTLYRTVPLIHEVIGFRRNFSQPKMPVSLHYSPKLSHLESCDRDNSEVLMMMQVRNRNDLLLHHIIPVDNTTKHISVAASEMDCEK